MIGYLKGQVLRKSAHSIILLVGGVGYELECPASTLWTLPAEGGLAQLEVLTFVREDAIRLFGFASGLDKQVFETLVAVSSVGPKLALALLGPFSGRELIDILNFGETERLLSVPGVGQRKVEKLMVEIGPKLQKLREAALGWSSIEPNVLGMVEGSGQMSSQGAVASGQPLSGSPAHPLFDDRQVMAGHTEVVAAEDASEEISRYERARAEKARRLALLADLESALANMGHREKVIRASLDWVEEEWRTGRLEPSLEVTLKSLLQRQSARLVSQTAAQISASETEPGLE